jgi:hypothetical protein
MSHFSFFFHASRFTSHASRFAPLILILTLFTALTLYQSFTLPLGEADDETDHYQYLQFVAHTGHPPFTPAERGEAGFKGGLAPLYYWLTAWPIALVGEQTPPDIRRVDARPERHIPTDGLGINHVLHTLDEQWPWRGQILAFHLVRLLSLPMAWITIIVTYALARRIWPQHRFIAIAAAMFVAFLPRFVISSAVINDDNLVFALITLLLLVEVIILQHHPPASPSLLALLGALFGLTLITKYFSLILIPEIVFVLRLALAKNDRRSILAFLTALALTAGPWFAFILIRFNQIEELGLIPGLAASLGEPQITEGLVGLLSGQSVRPIAATYSLPEWLSLLYRSFWFEFGWMHIFAPTWVYGLFTLLVLLALIGYIWRITNYKLQIMTYDEGQRLNASLSAWRSSVVILLVLRLALFLGVVLMRYVLSATIDTGQGRHLYPALAVIALFIAAGLHNLQFAICDLRLKIQHSPPGAATGGRPLTSHNSPFTLFSLLLAAGYLLLTLFTLHPSAFILPHYPTLPVTLTPPDELPIAYRHNRQFGDGLYLAGLNTPAIGVTGQTLPITLYWQAEKEALQDYLLSLCLQDPVNRPISCWRGHFADGRYPARAWEASDTLADTVFLPIPACPDLAGTAYRLRLELWPLQADSPEAGPGPSPVLQQTFTEPLITLQPDDSPPVNLWQRDQYLTGSQSISLNESLVWLDETGQTVLPRFVHQTGSNPVIWPPVPGFDSALYSRCGSAHLSHFVAGPTLLSGPYFPKSDSGSPPDVVLTPNLRHRIFAPITSTLTFTPYLSLHSIHLPNLQPLTFNRQTPNFHPPSSILTLIPGQTLPLTLRWQARRWMPDPLVVSLKLLDKDFGRGGEWQATLGGRYPNVLWAPTEMVEETYPLQVKADAPPGLYRLEVSLVRPDKTLPDGYDYLPLVDGQNLLGNKFYPLTVRILDPAADTPPPTRFSAQLGDSIRLIGYDISPISNLQYPYGHTSPISLALYWQIAAPILTDYTVFTQLVGPDGQVYAQWDNPPQAGRYPTTAWTPQETIIDRYTLTLRDGAPPGEYRLLVGMYNPVTGQRLPVTINGQPQPDNAMLLTTLTIDN